jgi:integrase
MTNAQPAGIHPDHRLPQPSTLVLANRPLRPDTDMTRLSVFADDRWILTPAVFEDHDRGLSLNFLLVPARFCTSAKHVIWQQLNHPEPPGLSDMPARRPSVSTIASRFRALAAFLHWLHAHGSSRLADVTMADLDAYLGDLQSAGLSAGVLAERVHEVRRLWAWRHLLPADDRLPDDPPWQGDETGTLTGRQRLDLENRTPRIHPTTMDRLLGWALRFVEVFADDIHAASRDYLELHLRSEKTRRRSERRQLRRRGQLQSELQAFLDKLRATGQPLPGRILPDGRHSVAWEHLGRMLDCWGHALLPLRRMVEASGIPIADAAYLSTPVTGRLQGHPWRDRPIAYHEAEWLLQHLSTACFIVIAYLSGMRPGEVLTLRRGCVRYDPAAGLWLLSGRKWKGAVDEHGAKLAEGQERTDPWVVVEPVARAVAVLERLHDQPLLFPTSLLTSHKTTIRAGGRLGKARTPQVITQDLARFVAWVNDYCASTGRDGEQIPPEPAGRPLTASRLRRTLAWFIVRRPRGLVAGAIQYGHVKVQITLGYSGTYASGFPDAHAFETWLLRLEQLADDAQRLDDGEHVSGPAADAYRQRVTEANRRFAGRTLTSTRQARLLLANPTLQLFPAKGMTCVFEQATAKCQLKPAGDDSRRTPDLDDCQPGCQNIARTDHDIAELRQQARELQALVGDPLSPAPRHQRERHQLERLGAIIDEHEQTRPESARSDQRREQGR